MADKPIKTYRLAGLSVAVFKNERKTQEGDSFSTFSAKLQKSYVDKSTGEFKNTDYLSATELLIGAALLQKAGNDLIDSK